MDPKNIKQLIVGVTAATSAVLLSEIAKQHHRNQRENSSLLAGYVKDFASKESMGEELRKRANLPVKDMSSEKN